MKKPMLVNVEEDDINYLNKNRINKSLFVRQAVKAYKDNKFEYNHQDE